MTPPRNLPKKSLGQNFLMHPQIAERIVMSALLPEGATVLEIGPGTGMLTRALLAKTGKVVAVEADDELVPQLAETFASEIEMGKLELIHGDIRSFDPTSLGNPYALVANIPYYITGEIMRMFLEAEHKPYSMTLLVQKEVAERIARSHDKQSILSLSVKAYGEPTYCFTVPRGAFRPAPNVDSAVISIQNIRNDAFFSPEEEKMFFKVLKTGFAHKRKRLAKNLEDLAPAAFILESLRSVGLDENIRSEDMKLDSWKALAEIIGAYKDTQK
ncbi:MAG: 16S rRNA (adenine(1518)-N(6)/adenine(1519)-N(6))-dimethyltransferase RsmA [Candidatus Paceibacterota bacterium]